MKRKERDPFRATTFVLAITFGAIVAGRAVGVAEAAKPIPMPAQTKGQPPAVRAQKILDTAKSTLLKVKADSEGRRNRAMNDIGTALVEAKSLSGGEDAQ